MKIKDHEEAIAVISAIYEITPFPHDPQCAYERWRVYAGNTEESVQWLLDQKDQLVITQLIAVRMTQ